MTTKSTEPAPRPDRAERAQPSGYTPPAVGAPTWPRPGDDVIHEQIVFGGEVDRLRAERDEARDALAVVIQERDGLIRGNGNLIAERDSLRDVIAHTYADLLAGRVDEAIAALRAAGGQP